MKAVAIIPARAGSKGLLGKNRRYLQDKHLLGWPIDAALNSKYIDRVFVSTEDHVLATLAEHYGAQVIHRPDELATDEATSADVILHALEWVKSKYFVFLEPTSPLTEASDIDTAFEMLVKNKWKADAIVGVSKLSTHHPYFTVRMENGFVKPYMTTNFQAMRRQELGELYFFDGSLYISTVKAFREHESFYHNRTMGYVTPKFKSFEIDDITDFVVVEALAQEIRRRKEQCETGSLV